MVMMMTTDLFVKNDDDKHRYSYISYLSASTDTVPDGVEFAIVYMRESFTMVYIRDNL